MIAYLATASVPPSELPALVRQVRLALADDAAPPPAAAAMSASSSAGFVSAAAGSSPVPAVPIEKSVFPDHLVSLEDGAHYRSLKRHLRVKYGMTPEEYRAKWGLPEDYPMVAPDYARDRSEVAKRIGLGKRRSASGTRGSGPRVVKGG